MAEKAVKDKEADRAARLAQLDIRYGHRLI
jgi:hypothetical protein